MPREGLLVLWEATLPQPTGHTQGTHPTRLSLKPQSPNPTAPPPFGKKGYNRARSHFPALNVNKLSSC